MVLFGGIGGEFFDEVVFGFSTNKELPIFGKRSLFLISEYPYKWIMRCVSVARYLHHVPGTGAVAVAYLDL
jgi:hypothetical protein